jgi:uncharacterized protein (DUF1330 family)
MAKAYLFGEIEVTDPATYEEYRSGCRRRLQRMGERTSFEALITNLLWSRARQGTLRVVILESPSRERLDAWYNSPEYKPVRDLRFRSAKTRVWLMTGVA